MDTTATDTTATATITTMATATITMATITMATITTATITTATITTAITTVTVTTTTTGTTTTKASGRRRCTSGPATRPGSPTTSWWSSTSIRTHTPMDRSSRPSRWTRPATKHTTAICRPTGTRSRAAACC